MKRKYEAKVNGTPSVRSIMRALDILEEMKHDTTGCRVEDLSVRVKLHRATAHRILTTLERRGFVDQDPATLRYKLGVRLLELGTAYWNQNDLARIAQPILEEISERTEQTCFLGVLDRDEVIIMAVAWFGRGLKVITRVGDRRPLYAAACGKILLANLPEADMEAYMARTKLIPLTEHTIASSEELRSEMKLARKRGYSENREGSFTGVIAIAAPVRDPAGMIHASISLAWPKDSIRKEKERELLQILLENAERLGSRLAKGVGLDPTHR